LASTNFSTGSVLLFRVKTTLLDRKEKDAMTNRGLKHGDWVLICDGRVALFAFNAGDQLAPNLQVRQKMEHAELASHEQGTDKPGRAFSGADARRSAMETTDFHRLEEEHFLGRVASALEQKVTGHEIGDLIVVAPPRVTGILRKTLPPSVRKVVRHEIEKDYVRMPIAEVERQVVRQLESG
jgi:protein required for attachment to host cells